jgi:hypothetical protein
VADPVREGSGGVGTDLGGEGALLEVHSRLFNANVRMRAEMRDLLIMTTDEG